MSAAASWSQSVNVIANPLVVRGVRSRLRPAAAATWGLITVAVTAFVFFIVYLTGVRRDVATPEAAAEATLVPIIIIQGLVLMLLGSGAVASGIARERMAHLLDYQRLTPMRPSAKIVGLLFGLPAREYFMFALTMPFVFYAVWKSGFPLGKLAQFYAVFFLSVWMYHMTGLVAGMVVDKPWRATLQAQGLVVVLYVVLPSLSMVGFSFLEFLTARPTFYSIVAEELQQASEAGGRTGRGVQGIYNWLEVRRWQEFRFFEMSLNPTLVSILVQLFVLVSLFLVVHRKWREEASHPVSKPFAIVFFACVQFFVLGSLWPHIRRTEMYAELFERLRLHQIFSAGPRLELVWIITFVALGIAGGLGAFFIHLVSPTEHEVVKGWRRTRKLGKRRLGWSSDAATGLPVTLSVIAVTGAVYWLLIELAERAGRFQGFTPGDYARWAPMAYLAAILLLVQFVREQASIRVAFVAGFLLWALPMFGFLIMLAAENAIVAGLYVGLPNPVLGIYATLSYMLGGNHPGVSLEVVPEDLAPHLRTLTIFGVAGYGGAAALLAVRWWAVRRRLRLTT